MGSWQPFIGLTLNVTPLYLTSHSPSYNPKSIDADVVSAKNTVSPSPSLDSVTYDPADSLEQSVVFVIASSIDLPA